ncbi:hypothetical protein FACS189481_1270 [Clostridia bacterium]|nr:hypothetical protein FACS189481_1270 [Clostridia bacterium]
MINALAFFRNILELRRGMTEKQQKLLEDLDNEIFSDVYFLMKKCTSWKNSEFVYYLSALEKGFEREKRKILKS